MAKTFVPIIGLAVVMALALAAVFGSMSLANPAQAQTTDAPPTVSSSAPSTMNVYTSHEQTLQLHELFNDGTGDGEITSYTIVSSAAAVTVGSPTAVNDDGESTATVTGAAAIPGISILTIGAVHGYDGPDDGTDADDPVTHMITATLVESSAPMVVDPAETTLTLYTGLDEMEIDLSDFFTDGMGVGMIDSYTVSEPDGVSMVFGAAAANGTADGATAAATDIASVVIGEDDDLGTLTFDEIGTMTGMVTLTVTAVDGFNTDGDDGTTSITEDDLTLELELMVSPSTSVRTTGSVMPQSVTLGETPPTVDVSGAFTAGDGTGAIDSYRAEADDGTILFALADDMGVVTLTGLRSGITTVMVTATDTAGGMDDVTFPVTVMAAGVVAPPEYVHPSVGPTFKLDDAEPGKNSWYTLDFQIDAAFNGGLHDMTIKLEEFGVPSSIDNNQIALEVTEPSGMSYTFNPASIGIDGKNIIITIPDVAPEAEVTKKSFAAMSNFKVILRQGAGISNPTRAQTYGGLQGTANDDREIFVAFAESGVSKIWLRADGEKAMGIVVPRVVILSEEDGGLGDMVMVEGLGFENGGTLHFFLDQQDAKGNPDGMLDSGEDILCSVLNVSGNAGSCEFEVTTPTFSTGLNYVNAVDGDGKMASSPTGGDNEFTLKASIKATPAGGSPGEIMQVQLASFPPSAVISEVKLSGNYICGGTPPGMDESVSCGSLGYGNVGTQGAASIGVTVPNWAVAGVQELFVAAGTEDDNVKVTIVGPRIVPTPQTVVANQRVSLVGTGFSPRSTIGRVAVGQTQIARISIGGDDIHWSRVNNGRIVEVDDGGNWSASVDLPLSEATTGTGNRAIRITDSEGRTGSVEVSLQERDFDITPPQGRVGTLAVVRGVGYPSKNDEGTSFTVDVIYNVQEGTSTRVSVVPDASGRFEVQVRIPTTAAIPSTNQVEVKFRLADGTEILENKQHSVPEGIITLSETSGGPGSTITVSGEGYKSFVNVDAVSIGTFDVTPAPKPHTNGNGMLEFDLLIPGIDVGIQTIEVQVGGTTSSVGFTVTESGVNPGDIVEVAKGVEDLGDNLVSVWNFNNDSKVWSFYDPTLAEGNTLTHMITGETYLIRIKADQEVILNRDTRSLTCVGDNCWNQIVW